MDTKLTFKYGRDAMLRIIPNLEFSQRLAELSETCRHGDDPLILTHEGRGDLVVMGVQAYNKLLAQMRLLQEAAAANARLVENETLEDEDLVNQAMQVADAKVQDHFRC